MWKIQERIVGEGDGTWSDIGFVSIEARVFKGKYGRPQTREWVPTYSSRAEAETKAAFHQRWADFCVLGQIEHRVVEVEGESKAAWSAARKELGMRRVRVSKIGLQPCEWCGVHAALRTLDVAVPALAAEPGGRGLPAQPALPAGWCPLIALCGLCWTDVFEMFDETTTTVLDEDEVSS